MACRWNETGPSQAFAATPRQRVYDKVKCNSFPARCRHEDGSAFSRGAISLSGLVCSGDCRNVRMLMVKCSRLFPRIPMPVVHVQVQTHQG